MRAKPGGGLVIAAAVVGCGLLGCAVRQRPLLPIPPIHPASEPAKPTVLVSNGTVLVVRPGRFAGLGGVLRERARLVREVGGSGGSAMVPLVEVVVREDDGRTVALMESPDDGLVAGERVLLVDGTPLRQIGSTGR